MFVLDKETQVSDMTLQLGDTVPNFSQKSSAGDIDFYDWAGDSWVVLFSHPAHSDLDATIIFGVNEDKLTPEDNLVSNGSCTTN